MSDSDTPSAQGSSPDPAEFDPVAADYRVQQRRSLGRFGTSVDYFSEYKVAAVARHLRQKAPTCRSILDFGSGIGASIPYFQRFFPNAALTCSDVSGESLRLAREAHGDGIQYQTLDGIPMPFEDKCFDVIFSACVFHHIPAELHVAHLRELRRLLKTGGVFFLFEHNPLNPLTLRVVQRCPFDENAVLIRAHVMVSRLREAGFSAVERRYRLFLPPALSFMRVLEDGLGWCALGAQYSLTATR